MMSGLINLDTNRVKVYRLLSENLREDRRFIWQGGIQYHHYSQKNGKGISPEEDSLRWKLTKVADCSYRIAPEVKCFLGENGYDKAQTSWQGTPLIPGMSASQSQALMLLRSINATFFSGFDAYILYWLRDGSRKQIPVSSSPVVSCVPCPTVKQKYIRPGITSIPWSVVWGNTNRKKSYRNQAMFGFTSMCIQSFRIQ